MQEQNDESRPAPENAVDGAYLRETRTRLPLGVGTLIGESFSLLMKNPLKISIVGALPLFLGVIPILFIVNFQRILLLDPAAGVTQSGFGLQFALAFGTVVVIFALSSALISKLVYDLKMQAAVRWGDYLKLLVSAAPRIAVLGTLIAVLWLAVSFVILSLSALTIILAVITVPAVVVLYFWVVTSFAVMPAVVAIEKSGFSSLKRSLALVRGYRWPVLGSLFLAGLCGGLINAILNIAAIALTIPVAYVSVTASAFLSVMLSVLIYGIYVSFILIVVTLAYLRLCEIKEGAGIDGIEAIFD